MYTVEIFGLTPDELDNCHHHPFWHQVKQTPDLEYACHIATGKIETPGIGRERGRVLDCCGHILIETRE
jgi:hypothetical protein